MSRRQGGLDTQHHPGVPVAVVSMRVVTHRSAPRIGYLSSARYGEVKTSGKRGVPPSRSGSMVRRSPRTHRSPPDDAADLIEPPGWLRVGGRILMSVHAVFTYGAACAPFYNPLRLQGLASLAAAPAAI